MTVFGYTIMKELSDLRLTRSPKKQLEKINEKGNNALTKRENIFSAAAAW